MALTYLAVACLLVCLPICQSASIFEFRVRSSAITHQDCHLDSATCLLHAASQTGLEQCTRFRHHEYLPVACRLPLQEAYRYRAGRRDVLGAASPGLVALGSGLFAHLNRRSSERVLIFPISRFPECPNAR